MLFQCMPQVCGDGRALCDGGVKEQLCVVRQNRLRLPFFGGGDIQPDGLWNGWGVN